MVIATTIIVYNLEYHQHQKYFNVQWKHFSRAFKCCGLHRWCFSHWNHKGSVPEYLEWGPESFEKGRVANAEKEALFYVNISDIIGHKIDAQGLHPLPEKVKAVKDAPKLRNVSELKSYLRLLSYYLKFLPNLFTGLAPLYELLRTSTKWEWKNQQEETFLSSKRLLTFSQVLVHFDPTKVIVLLCDASACGIGAVLAHQLADWSEKPIGLPRGQCQMRKRSIPRSKKKGLFVCFGSIDSMHISMTIRSHWSQIIKL